MTKIINGKPKLKKDLKKGKEELDEPSVQMAEHQTTCKNLSCENDLLSKQLSEITK